VWREHFEWDGPRLVGLTPEGRTTVHVLSINTPDYVDVRARLIQYGEFPPPL